MKQAVFIVPKENFLPNKGVFTVNRQPIDRSFGEEGSTPHIKHYPTYNQPHANQNVFNNQYSNRQNEGNPFYGGKKLGQMLSQIQDVEEPQQSKKYPPRNTMAHY